MPNLPDIICCDGDWTETERKLYERFKADFIDNMATLDGLPIRLKYIEGDHGKHEAFSHIITEGNDGDREEARVPNFRRCERIGWIRVIIEANGDPDLRRWEQFKNGQTTVAIALNDFSYVVFLAKRDNYYLLLTAYPVERQKRREHYRKEYEDFRTKNRA